MKSYTAIASLIKEASLQKQALIGAAGTKKLISALINRKNTFLAKKLPKSKATLRDIANSWLYAPADLIAPMAGKMSSANRSKFQQLISKFVGRPGQTFPASRSGGYLSKKFTSASPDIGATQKSSQLPWYRRFNREARTMFDETLGGNLRPQGLLNRSKASDALRFQRTNKSLNRFLQDPDTIKDLFK